MGLSVATLGLTNGIVLFVLPQLLAAENVPEARIAVITAAAVSPTFWFVFFGPILDVRFSRRWYATTFAAAASMCTAISILSLHRLLLLEVAGMLANATAALSSSALGGWLSNVVDHKDKNNLSKWMNIALICGMGVASSLGGELVRNLPVVLAATSLAALVLLPASIFLLIPAPGPDRRLASESFAQFNREVLSLLRRREVVIVLLLFLSPCSSFALTNLLGGLGGDFHASAREISIAGGVGQFFPGIVGCFLFPVIARRMPLRGFYLVNGILGSLFTLCLLLLPHHAWTFALAVFGEFLFQAIAFSIQIGIVFEVIGPDNPLAATTFSFLTAATNVPVTCMVVLDGHAYSIAGIAGSLSVDAAISIVTCLIAGLLMPRFDRKPLAATQATELAGS
jgi:PAT family beta-lactamase induction signal transducer AmpG